MQDRKLVRIQEDVGVTLGERGDARQAHAMMGPASPRHCADAADAHSSCRKKAGDVAFAGVGGHWPCQPLWALLVEVCAVPTDGLVFCHRARIGDPVRRPVLTRRKRWPDTECS